MKFCICGKEIVGRRSRRFCSDVCRMKAKRLRDSGVESVEVVVHINT